MGEASFPQGYDLTNKSYMVEYCMEMIWHLFANPSFMEHVEKIRAAKAKGEDCFITYEPNLSDYFYAGDIVFDISEGLGYLAYPESLMDCMFAVSLSDYENIDYKKVSWVPCEGILKSSIYPTDIVVMDKLAMMYGTDKMEDSIGCQIPFEIYKKDITILLDKLKIIA
jgi:hypothetical protein